MKVLFHISKAKTRNDFKEKIAAALKVSAPENVEVQITDAPGDCDLAVLWGVVSKKDFDHYREKGINVLYLDKGYTRERADGNVRFVRAAINNVHAVDYVMTARNTEERALKHRFFMSPWNPGKVVILAEGSAKYNRFADLPEPNVNARELYLQIRSQTSRTIWYRPKPSRNVTDEEGQPIDGMTYARDFPPKTIFDNAHVIVTHGSSIAFEGFMKGIPSIVLGNGICKGVCSNDLSEIENPKMVSDDERQQFLNNVAHCQFEIPEIQNGMLWNWAIPQLGW